MKSPLPNRFRRRTRHPDPRPPAPDPRSGFTLIEFIVTMAILAIILPAITLAFRTALDASDRVDRRSVMTSEARAVMPVLTRDIENAFVMSQTKGWLIGVDSNNGNYPADSLTMTTLSGRAPVSLLLQDGTPAQTEEPISPYQQVNYSLQPGGANGQMLLTREFTSPPGEDSTTTPTDSETLSDSVVGLNLEYFDGTDWQDNWDTTQDQTTTTTTTTGTTTTGATTETTPPLLPRSIRITLTLMTDGGNLQTYTTTVNPPMYDAGSSQIETDSSAQGTTTGAPGTTTGGGATTGGNTTGGTAPR